MVAPIPSRKRSIACAEGVPPRCEQRKKASIPYIAIRYGSEMDAYPTASSRVHRTPMTYSREVLQVCMPSFSACSLCVHVHNVLVYK